MDEILKRLDKLERLIESQNIVQKDVLNFNEACIYLELSQSHLYKLTSTRQIPHFCPQGKKLYFNRHELDAWLQRNRQTTTDEIEKQATNYIIKKGRA
ncbi:helix-turn-helix domain-containing protein [Deminuibacter soli]|uniref:DNA-binding protein n=1 Tax=Deminuibacter soli TaxID=2291815 RepID=A0A3E1NNT4_9BACT|nr:helix-turn-helix domain-containing protein [Deminuibacter soli]RFM29595.1 DNA-binding protein [Deminuibacter soli]